jgi:hypothetical protein
VQNETDAPSSDVPNKHNGLVMDSAMANQNYLKRMQKQEAEGKQSTKEKSLGTKLG